MINVIAVDNLRSVPMAAKSGLPLISYYAVAAIAFFIPVALVAAELATAYPRNGGIYIWIKEAFGQRIGFAAIWLQWIYNLIWFPTILVFIASTCTYLFNPEWAHHKLYLFLTTVSLFWFFTGLNCFGLKMASVISTIGAILGTILPMLGIILMAAFWMIQGHPPVNDFHQSIIPHFDSLNPFAMFIVIMFGLVGIEMSAIHAEDVENPKKDYPKAIAYSAVVIILSLVLSSLAILVVVPVSKLSLVTGLINAYELFFSAYHLQWMTPIMACLIVIGGLSGVSAWMIGPIKGLSIAAHESDIPKGIYQLNRYQAPFKMLVLQALIFTLISLCFVYIPSVSAAYWWLSDACSQIALVVYMMMFAAFIKLRYTQPDRERVYQVPGQKAGMWLVAGTGITCCIAAFLIGFISPSQIPSAEKQLSIGLMVAVICTIIVFPFWLGKKHAQKFKR